MSDDGPTIDEFVEERMDILKDNVDEFWARKDFENDVETSPDITSLHDYWGFVRNCEEMSKEDRDYFSDLIYQRIKEITS